VIRGLAVATEEAPTALHGTEESAGGRRRLGEVDDLTLRAAVNGDHTAFETIVGLYEPRLRILAYQILRDSLLVDDALQDVFFRVYRNLRTFRGDAALGTWLHRVTYTSCLNLLRKQRETTVPLELLDGDAALEQLDEELSIKLRLEHALASLDPEHRIAVLLVDRDGYDYGWVAVMLGIPVGTVASRLNTARRRLRAALGELEDAAGDDVVTKKEER
jgi:RNA polymerase sigma-70 factor, ECF subfamily